ncbi:MAG: CBS domain-containing protein [Gammaproteobacteria bacterium]|nr:CBS domain-containing protein [Gammaproteobacteria bacterium]
MLESRRVRDFMTSNLVKLDPDMEITHAVHKLVKHDIAGAPVVDKEGRLVGMLTEKDCMKIALDVGYYGEYGGKVAAFMSTEVETIDPDEGIVEAAKRFLQKRYHRYPVVRDGRLVGQISRRDVLRALDSIW